MVTENRAQSDWCPIRGFSGYAINELGHIRDMRRTPPMLLPKELLQGRIAVVRLVADGAFRPHPVSLDSLMLDNIIDRVENEDLYDLIHLDGDLMNCRLDNYAWMRKRRPANRPGPWRKR